MKQSQPNSACLLCVRMSTMGGILMLTALLGACGGGSTPPCTNCSAPVSSHYVFTANAGDATVSALASDKSSGALTSVSGSPFTGGSGALALAVAAPGAHIYVANALSGNISGFTIDDKTGRLSGVPGSPFAAEVGINSLAIDSTGKFLYAVSQNSANLLTFSISSNGSLAISGNPVVFTGWVGTAASSVVIDPTDKYLYVTAMNSGSGYIYQFGRDIITGTPTPLSSLPTYGQFLYGLANKSAFDPSGKMVLATGTQAFGTTGAVQVLTLDSSTGALSLTANSPVQVGVDPAGVVIDATGKFVYVPNTADATISAFVLDNTGRLTEITGSPFSSGGNGSIRGPLGIATDTTGHFVFVCNASNDISVFSINSATGALSPITGSPFPAGGHGPSAITFVP